VRCIPCEVAFQPRSHLAYPYIGKKQLEVIAQFQEHINKNHMRQNVGKGKQNMTSFGIFFTKIVYVQVGHFIPVKFSILYYVKL
jgi:hypothetical protein